MGERIPLTFRVTRSNCFEVTSHQVAVSGYIKLMFGYVFVYAHRHIWEECFGSIPSGLCVLHRCDNRKCINPEHLFLGTLADNIHDMNSKGRQRHPYGEFHERAKLTFEGVREIRRRYEFRSRKNNTYALACEFGVSSQTVWDIVNGRTWKEGA
jgi:hypothetical protein